MPHFQPSHLPVTHFKGVCTKLYGREKGVTGKQVCSPRPPHLHITCGCTPTIQTLTATHTVAHACHIHLTGLLTLTHTHKIQSLLCTLMPVQTWVTRSHTWFPTHPLFHTHTWPHSNTPLSGVYSHIQYSTDSSLGARGQHSGG